MVWVQSLLLDLPLLFRDLVEHLQLILGGLLEALEVKPDQVLGQLHLLKIGVPLLLVDRER